MKNRQRALRIHHKKRIKQRRKNYYGGYLNTEENQGRLNILVKTATLCSCRMCGNPRKFENEITFQEKRRKMRDEWELDKLEDYVRVKI